MLWLMSNWMQTPAIDNLCPNLSPRLIEFIFKFTPLYVQGHKCQVIERLSR